MRPGRSSPRSGKLSRRAVVVVVILVALVAGGALALRMRLRGPDSDPMHLGWLRDASDELKAGRHEQAGAILDRRAAVAAPTALDWLLRAQVAEARGRKQDALNLLKHIPETEMIAPQCWLMAGQIELSLGHARAAEAAFRHALTLNPKQVQSHRELEYIYALQRRRAECDAQFHILARLVAVDYVLAFSWGQNECDIWDPHEAIRALVPIVAADPDDRWSRLALANDYRQTLQFDLAEATLRPLPGSDPDARAIRVQMALDRGDPEAAERLIRDGPSDHARLNCLRGKLALQGNKPTQAASFFRAALHQEPRDRDAIQGLGTAMQKLGDPQAKDILHKAFRHDELKRIIVECGNSRKIDLKVFPKLGEICESLGHLDQARAWYQVAISWDPLDSQAQQGLARLDKMPPEQASGSIHGRDSTR